MIYFYCLGLAIALAVLIQDSPLPPSVTKGPVEVQPAPEIRGVWLTNVSSGVLFSPWGINRAIEQLSQLNFNTVYPVVWNRGYTFYPSKVAKQVTGRYQEPLLSWARPGGDTLRQIIKLGHDRKLRVIPWFEYGFMAPRDSQLVRRHPHWLTASQDGMKIHNKFNLEWLNPLHPEVQKLMLDLIREVVTKYDVDGIQIDDHFGMPSEYGYDDFTIKLYQQEHGGKRPPEDYHNPEWLYWRSSKITDFMQKLFDTVKEMKPDCLVSLSPNSQELAYRNYLQDWQTWVRRGLIDELVLQVYRGKLPDFRAELSQPAVKIARRKIPVAVGITSGTLKSPVTMAQIASQVQEVRDRGLDGVSFFYWESLWGYIAPESPRSRRRAFQELFSSKTTLPQSSNAGIKRYMGKTWFLGYWGLLISSRGSASRIALPGSRLVTRVTWVGAVG